MDEAALNVCCINSTVTENDKKRINTKMQMSLSSKVSFFGLLLHDESQVAVSILNSFVLAAFLAGFKVFCVTGNRCQRRYLAAFLAGE